MINSVGLMNSPALDAAETADDRKINVSGGEFVMNADAVRWIGVEKLMQMQQKALQGIMQQNGQQPMQPGQPTANQRPAAGAPISKPSPPSMMQGLLTPPQGVQGDVPSTANKQPPTPATNPNQPRQQPQTNFATGGYVAPAIPNQPRDWMQYQNYYANMNTSAPPKTVSSISPQGGWQQNYVDPVTGKPVETQKVNGTASTVAYTGAPTSQLKAGPGKGGGLDTSDLVTTALVGAGVPLAGALLKEVVKSSGVGDYIKSGIKDIFGGSAPVVTAADAIGDVSWASPVTGVDSFVVPSASNPELLGTTTAFDDVFGITPVESIMDSPAFGGGTVGADALGGSLEAGSTALEGGIGGGDALLSGLGVPETNVPVGLDFLGGAEGIFPGGSFSATAGGVTGALGGLMSAMAYAAPAAVIFTALSMLNQSSIDPVTVNASGKSSGLGDLDITGSRGDQYTTQLNDFYSNFLGDRNWYGKGDPSKVGEGDFHLGLASTKKNLPYWAAYNNVGYSTPGLAINSGRQSVNGLMGNNVTLETLPNMYRYDGADNAAFVDMIRRQALPVYDAAEKLPDQWDYYQRMRQTFGTGEGQDRTNANYEAFYNGLSERQKQWFDSGLTTKDFYAYTGLASPDYAP